MVPGTEQNGCSFKRVLKMKTIQNRYRYLLDFWDFQGKEKVEKVRVRRILRI